MRSKTLSNLCSGGSCCWPQCCCCFCLAASPLLADFVFRWSPHNSCSRSFQFVPGESSNKRRVFGKDTHGESTTAAPPFELSSWREIVGGESAGGSFIFMKASMQICNSENGGVCFLQQVRVTNGFLTPGKIHWSYADATQNCERSRKNFVGPCGRLHRVLDFFLQPPCFVRKKLCIYFIFWVE